MGLRPFEFDPRPQVDAAAARTCVATVSTLLTNAETKPEAKFRKVRLANKAIQDRVLAVEGGLEVLCAAGFQLAEDGAETVLVLSDDFDRPRLRAAADALGAAKARLGDA